MQNNFIQKRCGTFTENKSFILRVAQLPGNLLDIDLPKQRALKKNCQSKCIRNMKVKRKKKLFL